MSREINYNKEARLKLKAGADKLANAVKVTLGAKGRNVIIQKEYGDPDVTKDGVTVANNIALPDPVENMGAQMFRQASQTALKEGADGTTTTCVLAQSILDEAIKVIDSNTSSWVSSPNPMDIKRGIDKAVEVVVSRLESLSEKISHDNEKVIQIATISANNDEFIGGLIAEAMSEVTPEGIIKVEESKTSETKVEITDGLSFVNGIPHPAFVNNFDKLSAEHEDVNILFFFDKVSTTKQILPIIEMGLRTSKPLVIIANEFDGAVIQTFVQNKEQKGFVILPIRIPELGDARRDAIEDLAIYTGGTVITPENGITPEDFTLDMFGAASKIVADKRSTTIIHGQGEKSFVEKRIDTLKGYLEDEDQEWDEVILKRRISRLRGKAAILYVGANTEVEMKERRDRVDDALGATRAAISEGIVAGGGVALLEASKEIDILDLSNRDQKMGADILRRAIEAPICQIALNSGLNPREVLKEVREIGYPYGYDAKEDRYVNMIEEGIVDPKKITRIALESAASVASMIFTSEATVSLIKED